MHNELIKRLRDVADEVCEDYDVDPYSAEQRFFVICEAANAIEELLAESAGLVGQVKRSQEEIRKLDKEIATILNKLPRWIPVSARLPENGYYVLAYEDGDIVMASYEGGNWVLRDLYEVVDDLKPTHWMPLPQPPKEG